MKNLARSNLGSFIFITPSLDDQLTIISRLRTESVKFDALAAGAQRAIDFLQEQRTTLISAAVTGKTDTHSLVKSDSEAA